MIRITGDAKFKVDFDIVVDMSEEQWDALSTNEQDEIIDSLIEMEDMSNSVLCDADVHDVKPFQQEI